MRVFEIPGTAGYYETLTTATAVGFTSAKILPTTGNFIGKQARAAIISVELFDIRFTIDGTVPVITATGGGVGHLLPAGSSFEISGELNVSNFRCINAVASSGAIVRCTFLF